MRIGLTGGIASGKSTVLAQFKAKGASTIDADVVAREVVAPGTEGLKRVKNHFGAEVIKSDGTLNRRKLGQLIFADESQRQTLNRLLHPLINTRIRRRMQECERAAPDVPVVVDIPLLVENQLQDMFDRIVVVYIPRKLQMERLMKRDGLTEEEANQRIQAQMPLEDKKQVADDVIDNSGGIENTERQVGRIWVSLRQEMGQGRRSSDGHGN